MKVYVGTYGKYASGSLEGEWIDLDDFYDYEEFVEKCREIHSDEKEPEFMFQDFEGDELDELFYSESSINKKYWDYSDLFVNLSNDEREALGCYLSNYNLSRSKIQNAILDMIIVSDFEDYAYEIANETMQIPDEIKYYFDYEAYARDLEFDYNVFELSSGECAIFPK